MDNAVKERLVGAAILVVLVVLVVPALLSGPREPVPAGEPPSAAADAAGEVRVVEIDLSRTQAPVGTASVPDIVEDPVAMPPPAPEAIASPAPQAGSAVVADQAAVQAAEPAAPPASGPKVVPASPMPGGAWAVQVAALSSQDAAAKMVAELRGKGYSAFVLEHRADGRVFYRVRVGPEPQRNRADALAARLQAEGMKPSVVSHP
ncbi:MAG: hypothetical protein H6R27_784 [Proteobacteria bacterium]|nr:hypothetical protein [Pseudomonadota bacterium]